MFGSKRRKAQKIEKIKQDIGDKLVSLRDAFAAAAEKPDPGERYLKLWDVECEVTNWCDGLEDSVNADFSRPATRMLIVAMTGVGTAMPFSIDAAISDASFDFAAPEFFALASMATVLKIAYMLDHPNSASFSEFSEQAGAIATLAVEIKDKRRAAAFDDVAAFACSPHFSAALAATPGLAQELEAVHLQQKLSGKSDPVKQDEKNKIEGFTL